MDGEQVESRQETPRVEAALHTYLAVGDVRQVRVEGLEQDAYIDKVGTIQERPATGEPIVFEQETDRVYVNTRATCRLVDPSWNRTIQVSKRGSLSTIVWNPWIDKSARMPDFGDNEWPEMVCIGDGQCRSQRGRLDSGGASRIAASIAVE